MSDGTPANGYAGHSVLVVPVRAFEPLVRARHEHYDRTYVSTDPTFAHAHITVLGPWLAAGEITPKALRTVREIASRIMPFDVRLATVAAFPNGIIHLVPEPEEPFAALTAALWGAFPSYPPYAGEFGAVRPHLTIDAVGADVTEEVVRGWVAPLVPVRQTVDRIQVSWYEPGACRTLASLPLGE